MNRIVVGLCCVLVSGVASGAANSGVVMIAETDVSAQEAATFPADVDIQVQSNARTQIAAGTSAGITVTASAVPELAARIRGLESSFRCLVCQNETIADST
ncbi:MAG TPA: cytochrome c-type biogenesis protein CcmH, partial [Caballeronia sp.]|nr:cytochrome c-type biogenesis protein CcmH [Caballeronia sp.]